MKKINLEIEINASREAVWDSIVNVKKYGQWANVFMDGSYFEGGWNKGDAIRFIAVNDQGQKEGMASEIAESKYPEFISIRHMGYIYGDVIDTTSEEIAKWAPSYENYSFIRLEDKKTLFKLEMDAIEEYHDMFMELWPKALKRIKEISES